MYLLHAMAGTEPNARRLIEAEGFMGVLDAEHNYRPKIF